MIEETNSDLLQELQLNYDISNMSSHSIIRRLKERLSYEELYLLFDRVETLETVMVASHYQDQQQKLARAADDAEPAFHLQSIDEVSPAAKKQTRPADSF